ncbi:MAG: PKD domain protein [Methanoregulaceae archaeon PtaB.Bin056]|nr:MAG: PKD domain protein [Methanoregulaceae archaeon PtaB.Bin056]
MSNLSSGEVTLLTPNTDSSDEINPSLSGNTVVWQSVSLDTFTSDIISINLESGETVLLTPDTNETSQEYPVIFNNTVVFLGVDPKTGSYDIFLYDIHSGNTTVIPAISGYSVEERPSIYEDMIVWTAMNIQDYSRKIFFYRISTGEIFSLIQDGSYRDPFFPSLFEDRVVWSEYDIETGHSDVRMVTLGTYEETLIADFTTDLSRGEVPLKVNFTDLSTGEPSGWHWDFGDGNTSAEQNPSHIYSTPGVYDVSLIVHTPYQRSGVRFPSYIYAGSPPTPAFSFDTYEGLAPLTVNFTDQSAGSPETYFWDFGDGSTSTEKDPSHTFLVQGSYRVSLTAGNEFGNSTSSVEDCIVVLSGVRNDLLLDIPGITCQDAISPCRLSLNSSLLDLDVIHNTTIEVKPDPSKGIEKILLISDEGFSWLDQFSLEGNLTGVDISSIPLLIGGSGDNSTMAYRVHMDDYPLNGSFHAEVWKNATPLDYEEFKAISILEGYSGICGVAFTARFVQCNISGCPEGTLLFGIDSGWIEKYGWRRPVKVESDPEGAQVYFEGQYLGLTPLILPDELPAGNHTLTIYRSGYGEELRNVTLTDKRESIRVIRIAEDGSYEMLPATFLSHDDTRNLDYFITESSAGLSTFGAVSTSHAGSPIQIIYLALSEFITSLVGGGGGGGPGYSASLSSYESHQPTIPPTNPIVEEIPPVTPITIHGTPAEVTATETGVNSERPVAPPVPTNIPDEVPPIPFTMIQGIAIVSAIVLVAGILVLRWQKGGEQS